MKYLISLHFAPGWGTLFIYFSIITLLVGLALAVIEDAKSGTDAENFAKLRKRWLLQGFIAYWGVYVVSLSFAQSIKAQLPVYQYELSEVGCQKIRRANIEYTVLDSGHCKIYGNILSDSELQQVIYSGSEQVELDKCDIKFQRLRDFEEFRKEFDELYDSKGWWP